MSDYQLSNAAENDISQILEYSYQNFGEQVAEKYYQSLKQCFEILKETH